MSTSVRARTGPDPYLSVNIYLHSGRYCLMETRNCSLSRSSGGVTFLLLSTYSAVPNYISLCYSSSMSLLIYVAT